MEFDNFYNINTKASKYYGLLLRAAFYSEKNHFGKITELVNSFSTNQIQSKKVILDGLDKVGAFDSDTQAVVLGSWFGTTLYPGLIDRQVMRITGFDMDPYVTEVSNFIFDRLKTWPDSNIDIRTHNRDIWLDDLSGYNLKDANIVINTACEHMPPMKDWSGYKEINSEAIYAFQSCNINASDHINLVNSMEEFIEQLHPGLDVMYTNTLPLEYHNEGSYRFTVIGQF